MFVSSTAQYRVYLLELLSLPYIDDISVEELAKDKDDEKDSYPEKSRQK